MGEVNATTVEEERKGSWKRRMQLLAGAGENVILYDKVQAKRRNNIWTRVCDFRKWKQDGYSSKRALAPMIYSEIERKVGQRKTISGQRKTLSSQRKTLSGQQKTLSGQF
ncbi:hypothetical protein NC651_000822 [Populus alba x Populus x berolinensis]|nr:hypothetical protein NC651_000822 [Populus alba x Populus x berolinensis]